MSISSAKKSRLRSCIRRLFAFVAFGLWASCASGAQDCFNGNLTVNANGVDFGVISPGQLGLSSNDLAVGATPTGFTLVSGPGAIDTVLDGSAYSGLPVLLTPEVTSTNNSDWSCIMLNPNRNDLVVRYQLTAANGQAGGLSIGGQFVPVTLETDITLRRIFFFFVEVSGRIRAFPDLSNLTVAGNVEGTIQIEVFEQ